MVASGVDFFVGIAAVEAGLALGLVFVVAGEDVLVGEAEGFGVGDVFSVVTETLGSVRLVSALSGIVTSGESAGDGLAVSSCANPGRIANTIKARTRTSVFIWIFIGGRRNPAPVNYRSSWAKSSGGIVWAWQSERQGCFPPFPGRQMDFGRKTAGYNRGLPLDWGCNIPA